MGNSEERKYYIDFSSVRGGNIIKELGRTITRLSPDKPTCQLFTGHIGCGKSTELQRLKAELEQQGFHVVYFESSQVLEMADVDVTDILLAIANLEQVRQNCNPQYDPQLYIDSLGELRSLYFKQGEYGEAFGIKQEQFQIEHQYGSRSFIGARYLQPKRSSVNPAVGEMEQQGTIAQEIAVSSREQDVKRLIEIISRNDCKLTVIHGQSGVGKSSILQGGLVPALHQ
jgi:excinuclease UvrABC ATPase subunit